MPFSIRDNDKVVREYVRRNGLRTALDVGAGGGTYALLMPDMEMDAIEAWPEYVERFGLKGLYRDVFVGDVRDLVESGHWPRTPFYDLIIFGDVLEHMSAEDGKQVWEWAKSIAIHGLISVPTVDWPQGAVDGNPFEVHVQDHVHPSDYQAAFGPFDETHLFDQTATFVTRFPRSLPDMEISVCLEVALDATRQVSHQRKEIR